MVVILLNSLIEKFLISGFQVLNEANLSERPLLAQPHRGNCISFKIIRDAET
jgi:hypothetical protein